MKSFFCLTVFLLSLIVPFAQTATETFYVSPSGADKNPGTIEKPFASLEKARKAVRIILKKDGNTNVKVYFRTRV